MAGDSLLSFLLLSIWVNGGGLVAALGSNDVVFVRYGYFAEARPVHAACGRGWFNLARNVQEDTPEYVVECFPQSSGGLVVSRLDNAQLDIAHLGSTPWATSVARGLDLKEIYIDHYKGSSQGIYVRNGVGIMTPYDLNNRTIGTPFGSTTHYQTLFMINLFGLTQHVNLINLSPTDIVKAWKEKRIDGAAVWGGAREYVLANEGRELISADVLAKWGSTTYNCVAARAVFGNDHTKFLNHFVGMLSRINDSFLDRLGLKVSDNAARWTVKKNDNQTTKSLVNPLVDQLMIPGESPGNPSYAKLVGSREALELFVQQSASEQLACEYMGDSMGCSGPTGQEQATINTATFLFEQKFIPTLGNITRRFFDPTYLAAATSGISVVTPLGSYENEFVVVDNSNGPDPVLEGLEKLDIKAGKSPYATYEVGRANEGSVVTAGDSNCQDDHIISGESLLNGTIGDGANTLPGRSYSDNQFCRWTIHPIDALVEVRIHKLRIWSGDFLRIYSGGVSDCPGGNKPRKLLAQLSGIYEDAEVELPPFRSNTCIVVEFKTDGNQERGYAVAEDYGDGFELFYSRDKVPEGDCNGKDSDSDGLCLCGGTSWGSDCSRELYCIGTTRVLIEEGTEHVIQSSFHATQESLASQVGLPVFPYPNDLDCVYELETKDQYDFVKVELYYDLEDTFDLLTLQAGSGVNATQYAILSGSQTLPEVYYVPVDENGMASLHLTTDDKGRRGGFYAKVSGHSSAVTECLEGQFGSQCEAEFCLSQNQLYQTQQSLNNEFNAGRVISQHPSKAVRAMPWAPDGGCTWEIKPKRDSTGSIRLIIEKFDLEPHTNKPGDKLVIRSDGEVDSEDTELFIQSCKEDDDCEYGWQTGKCSEGGCAIRDQVELEVRANDVPTSVLLSTDRNDGQSIYSGIDFDVHYVQSCPASAINNCLEEGGLCSVGGLCICSDSIACDCSCEFGASNSSSKGRLIALGILTGVIAILCGAVLYCALVILCYEMRQRYHAGIRRC